MKISTERGLMILFGVAFIATWIIAYDAIYTANYIFNLFTN